MTPSFVVGITHAPHATEREANLHKLRSYCWGRWPVYVEDKPGKPHEWSERVWRGALSLADWSTEHAPDDGTSVQTTHALFLNDDVSLCSDFAEVLTAAIAAKPDEVVNLYQEHEYAAVAAREGLRWVTSPDGLVGTAYVMPIATLRHFIEWRKVALRDGAVERLSEDQLINLHAMCCQRHIWHTVPALVDHLPFETLFPGNRKHRPMVTPWSEMPRDWDTDSKHSGRIFKGNHWALLTQIKPEAWRHFGCLERAHEIDRDRDLMKRSA